MNWDRLSIIHFDRRKGLGPHPKAHDREALFLETCQRIAWIGERERLAKLAQQLTETEGSDVAFEIYTGAQAFRFLLRVACGLESEIQGETDIFGQVKDSWSRYQGADRSLLHPVIQQLFEETKRIRTQFLQGIGGSSYGSLVRRLLDLKTDSSILVLGAGQIAQSVLPYLQSAQTITLWNRSESRLLPLQKWVHQSSSESLQTLDWKSFNRLLVCLPHATEYDQSVLTHWNQTQSQTSTTIAVHLGVYREEAPEFSNAGFTCLNELFELQRAQSEIRSLRISEALRAIDERYRIRQKEAV